MQEAVKLISENGLWVFLIGILNSIIIGAVKTPIRAKFIDCLDDGEDKSRREDLFDTLTFISTYVIAFIAAIIYYPISTLSFNLGEIFKLTLPIWLSQSLAYGAWKKLGIKRFLAMLAKLIFKDINSDGEISVDEAISQIVKGIKEGKFDVESLVSTVNGNLSNIVEEVATSAKDTEEAEKVEKVMKTIPVEIAANKKEVEMEIAKPVSIGRSLDGTEVYIRASSKIDG